MQVTKVDFDRALGEVRPAFGVSTDDLNNCVRGGMIAWAAHSALPHTLPLGALLAQCTVCACSYRVCVVTGMIMYGGKLSHLLTPSHTFSHLLTPSTGMIMYGGKLSPMLDSARQLLAQMQASEHTSLLSVLLEGPPGAGKTQRHTRRTATPCSFPSVRC